MPPLNWLDCLPPLFSFPLTILLFWVAAALGNTVLSHLKVTSLQRKERGLFAAGLGLGLLSFVPFLLFSVGAGRPRWVAAAILLIALTLRREEFRLLKRGLHFLHLKKRTGFSLRYCPEALLFAGILPLLCVTFCFALCPPTDPDGLHYHLTAPRLYLTQGYFSYQPTLLHLNWPLAIEMLFGIGMAFSRNYPAAFIQFGFGILLLFSLVILGRRLATPFCGMASAALTFFFVKGEMAWAYIDVGLSFFTLLALFSFYLGWIALDARSPDKKDVEADRLWTLGAVFAGFTAAAKLPGLLVIFVFVLMVFSALKRKGDLLAFRKSLRLFRVGFLIVLPWYLRCWWMTGSPLYPYLGGVLGAKDWSPDYAARLTEYFQVFNTFHRGHLTGHQVYLLRAAAGLMTAICGISFCRWKKISPLWPVALFFFAMVFLQIVTSGIYLRFLLPEVGLGALLLSWLVDKWAEKVPAMRWGYAFIILVLLWGGGHPGGFVKTQFSEVKTALPVMLGSISKEDYLREKLAVYPLLAWCNARLPPNSGLALGVIDAYAGLVDCHPLITHYWTQNAIQYKNFEQTAADLKRGGATHLLLRDEPPPTEAELNAMDLEVSTRYRIEFPRLREVGERMGKRIFTLNGYVLYALPR